MIPAAHFMASDLFHMQSLGAENRVRKSIIFIKFNFYISLFTCGAYIMCYSLFPSEFFHPNTLWVRCLFCCCSSCSSYLLSSSNIFIFSRLLCEDERTTFISSFRNFSSDSNVHFVVVVAMFCTQITSAKMNIHVAFLYPRFVAFARFVDKNNNLHMHHELMRFIPIFFSPSHPHWPGLGHWSQSLAENEYSVFTLYIQFNTLKIDGRMFALVSVCSACKRWSNPSIQLPNARMH